MTLSEFEIKRCEKVVAEFIEQRRPPPKGSTHPARRAIAYRLGEACGRLVLRDDRFAVSSG
jgi:hypothetical protein